jgi:hypothetical protein
MTPGPDDYKAWGRERLIFLQLGYMFLTHQSTKISEETKSFIAAMKLSNVIGQNSLKMAELDERPGLMLAERVYSHVMVRDEVAYQDAVAADDAYAFVFKDPLVYSRCASSMFLQERFAQAKSVLDQILYTTEWHSLIERGDITKFDVSEYEMYMRHSQYVFFKNYREDDKIVDNIKYITRDLEHITKDISKHLETYNEKHFRSVAWCLVVMRYLHCLNSIIPAFYTENEQPVVDYLRKHAQHGFHGSAKRKPEALCAACLIKMENTEELHACVDDAIKTIDLALQYPRTARMTFTDMLARIEDARVKSAAERPRVFFSYSHEDERIVDLIVSYLIDANVEILSDRQFITGDSLLIGVEKAIMSAEVAIIFVSKNYLNSVGWLQKERETIFARNVNGDSAVVVLTYEVSDDEIRDKFPMLVNSLTLSIDDNKVKEQIFQLAANIYRIWTDGKKKTSGRKKPS